MKITARQRRLVTYAIAAAALAFVARAVPIRDRCEEPGAPAGAPRVSISREGDACIVHRAGGPERVDAATCARFDCEPGVVSAVKRTRGDVIIGLFVVYMISTLMWAARWRLLLGLAGVRMSLASTWRVTLEAQAGGVLLPGGIGGDAFRIATAVSRGAPAPIAVGSVLLDRALGLVTMASVALGLATAFGGNLGVLAPALAAIPLGLAVGLLLLRSPLFAARPWLTTGIRGRVLMPIVAYVRHARAPRAIGGALVLSTVVSIIQLAVIRGLVFGLGATPTSEPWVYLGTTVAFMVGAVPALPGGWGTSDAAFVFFFSRAGLAAATALAVVVVYRLFWYASGIIGSLLLLAGRSRREPEMPKADP